MNKTTLFLTVGSAALLIISILPAHVDLLLSIAGCYVLIYLAFIYCADL